jgi:hypothetical protein
MSLKYLSQSMGRIKGGDDAISRWAVRLSGTAFALLLPAVLAQKIIHTQNLAIVVPGKPVSPYRA